MSFLPLNRQEYISSMKLSSRSKTMKPALSFSCIIRFLQYARQRIRSCGCPLSVLLIVIVSTAGSAPVGVVRGTITSGGSPLVGAEVRVLELNRAGTTD